MPPHEAAEVQVAQFVALVLAVEPPLAAAELLELLLQPAASRMDPTAAADATIAFDARKVKPSHAAPRGTGGERWHLG
jgi:hypothetical protein